MLRKTTCARGGKRLHGWRETYLCSSEGMVLFGSCLSDRTLDGGTGSTLVVMDMIVSPFAFLEVRYCPDRPLNFVKQTLSSLQSLDAVGVDGKPVCRRRTVWDHPKRFGRLVAHTLGSRDLYRGGTAEAGIASPVPRVPALRTCITQGVDHGTSSLPPAEASPLRANRRPAEIPRTARGSAGRCRSGFPRTRRDGLLQSFGACPTIGYAASQTECPREEYHEKYQVAGVLPCDGP